MLTRNAQPGARQEQGAGQQRQRTDSALLPLLVRNVPGVFGVRFTAREKGSSSKVEVEEVSKREWLLQES